MKQHTLPQYSIAEDVTNSITHGVAAALSIAGLSVLVVLASLKGDPWRIVSFSIYGATLVSVYITSTLYHGIQHAGVKRVFRRLDHIMIYLLIAGTYTPFTLVTMRGASGWFLFSVVWGLALAGIVLKTFFMHRFEILSVILYVGMGWTAVLAIKPVIALIPVAGLVWMLVGGLFYTLGIIFYAWDRLPFNHVIWHCFVIAGSTCHFFVMLFVVLP